MTHDRDPFDGPAPVGPLGEAMARLTDDAPPAGFTEYSVRYHVDNARSVRRQVFGGIAAAAAAIAVLVLFVTTIGRGGSDSATTAASSIVSTSSSAAAANAAPSSASLSAGSAAAESSSAAATSGATSSGAESFSLTTGAPGQLPENAGGSPVPTGESGADAGPCRPVPLDEAQLQAVESILGGPTRLDTCALADADAGVQRYAVAGGTVVVERRAGTYDPCAGTAGAICVDVPDRPGVRTADIDGVTRVWISGRDGSVVLTADPVGAVPVDTLAAAAGALAAVAP